MNFKDPKLSILIDEILSYCNERYYQHFDKAHSRSHMLSVLQYGLLLQRKTTYMNTGDVVAAALLHDIGLINGRENHELNGYNLLNTGDDRSWMDGLCIKYDLCRPRILLAIREHRASYKGEFSSVLSEIISSADRGYPDINLLLKRCSTKKHIVEKYSRNGYAKYPKLYQDYFKVELEKLYNAIDNLVIED